MSDPNHPQAILRAVMDRSDLTDDERADAAEAMYFAVLGIVLDELPESNPPPQEDLVRACGVARGRALWKKG